MRGGFASAQLSPVLPGASGFDFGSRSGPFEGPATRKASGSAGGYLLSFSAEAQLIFAAEPDDPADIAEDVLQEALETLGVSKNPVRLFGKVDYKRARYVFHEDYAIRQALFVDSKAERDANSATLQVSQTSMRIRHIRAGVAVDVPGMLPTTVPHPTGDMLTTTIIVKFVYSEVNGIRALNRIRAACIPSGMLQARYNPTAQQTFWMAGRDAPTLGEDFRVRVSFALLQQMAAWRVQDIRLDPPVAFQWTE
ncbi:MAG: BglI family type II restriction endonuclease [Acidobacteriia bacterium]|nr:BglI family type II restriction endonuclease [Terriglobia bacterium]